MEADRRLEFSALFTRTVYTLFYRPVTALLIAGATIYLPIFAVSRLLPAPEGIFTYEFARWSLLSVPIFSLAAIFQAWITIQAIEGNAARGALTSTISRLPQIHATSVVVTAIAVVGLYALVVPGVLWGLACVVAIPVVAVERVGVGEAIRRSFQLTKGRRLALFGYSLIILIPMGLASMWIELAIVGGRWELVGTSPAKAVFEALSAMVGAAYTGAAYAELTEMEARAGDPVE